MLCLLALAVTGALVLGVGSVAALEVRESFARRESARVRESAHAALDLAGLALGRASTLSAVLGGVETAPLWGGEVVALHADRSLLVDLGARRARLQRRSDAGGSFGANQPTWQPFLRGHLSAVGAGLVGRDDVLVAAWVADDPGEADGDPRVDTNGLVQVQAEAYGAGGVRAALRASLERRAGWTVVRRAWVGPGY